MLFAYFFLEVPKYSKKWSILLIVTCLFYLISTLAIIVGIDISLLPRITFSGLIYYFVLLVTGIIAIRQKQYESILYTLGIIICSIMAITQLISLFNNPNSYFATPQFFRLAWYMESIFLILAFINNYRRLINTTQTTQKLLSETQTKLQDFKNEYDSVARKLVTSTIQNDQYNKTIEGMKIGVDGKLNKQIEKSINLSQATDEQWQNFKFAFEKVHPDFFQKITKKYGQLTINEQRHIAFIKLNLTIKEIAQLTGVTTQAVKMARNRLKKKLNTDQSITDFVHFITKD